MNIVELQAELEAAEVNRDEALREYRKVIADATERLHQATRERTAARKALEVARRKNETESFAQPSSR